MAPRTAAADPGHERNRAVTSVRSYLEEMRPYWSELTVEQRRRDLNTVAKDLWILRKSGKLRNVRPDKINEADVGALL